MSRWEVLASWCSVALLCVILSYRLDPTVAQYLMPPNVTLDDYFEESEEDYEDYDDYDDISSSIDPGSVDEGNENDMSEVSGNRQDNDDGNKTKVDHVEVFEFGPHLMDFDQMNDYAEEQLFLVSNYVELLPEYQQNIFQHFLRLGKNVSLYQEE